MQVLQFGKVKKKQGKPPKVTHTAVGFVYPSGLIGVQATDATFSIFANRDALQVHCCLRGWDIVNIVDIVPAPPTAPVPAPLVEPPVTESQAALAPTAGSNGAIPAPPPAAEVVTAPL